MLKIFITGFLWGFFILFAFSQNVDHVRESVFLKRVEHNMIMLEADYNLKSKGDVEKLFWGNFNAPVEFFYDPSPEARGTPSGFRLLRDSLSKSAILEVKYIHSKVETLSFPISDQFAGMLYSIMSSFIVNFKVKGIPVLSVDGYSVTFRSVVDDEVWSLWMCNPRGNLSRKMAELCVQIITDARATKLDESKYITVLNTFEN